MIEYVITGRQILEMLENAGYSNKRIVKEKLLTGDALQQLRENKMVGIKTLGKICDLLEVQPHILIKNVTEPPKSNNQN